MRCLPKRAANGRFRRARRNPKFNGKQRKALRAAIAHRLSRRRKKS